MQTIYSLKNTIDCDAYVVGGGKSLDYYPKGFFENRFVLAVNQASRIVPADYIVRKENAEKGIIPVIASEYKAGCSDFEKNESDYYFEHNHNTLSQINIEGCHPLGDKIIVSWSTITSAIHLAAFMGARTIFLVGHDCATIDGEQVADGYYDGVQRLIQPQDYNKWLALIAPQTAIVRDYIKKEYHTNVVPLSPFIGLKHEGHIIE